MVRKKQNSASEAKILKSKDVDFSRSDFNTKMYYTRILVGLCLCLWYVSFFPYLGAEWLHTQQVHKYAEDVPRPPHVIILLLRISSTLALLAGFTGWWGALHQRHNPLFTFTCIIFFTSVIEIACSSVTLSYAGKTSMLIQELVVEDINLVQDSSANSSTDPFLELQSKLQCCGVSSYRDWIDSPWWMKQRELNTTAVVPMSCCASQLGDGQCNVGTPPFKDVAYPDLMHETGCLKRVSEYMDSLFYVTGGMAFGAGFAKFLGFFLVHYLINVILRYQHVY